MKTYQSRKDVPNEEKWDLTDLLPMKKLGKKS